MKRMASSQVLVLGGIVGVSLIAGGCQWWPAAKTQDKRADPRPLDPPKTTMDIRTYSGNWYLETFADGGGELGCGSSDSAAFQRRSQ
jgi:hypothetical protein